MKVYKGVTEAEHHRVLHEVSIDKAELLDFYKQFPRDTHLGWNEFKKKYNPNNPYRRTLTDDFKQVYAPAYEGKEFIEYPFIQRILNLFNFRNPLIVTDIQILAYEPGFAFVPHIDQEVNWSIMIPILPDDGGEPLIFHEGDDFRNPGPEIYRLYYSAEHPTLVTGKVIHSVEEMKAPRVILRIRSGDETYEELIAKINAGNFFKQP